MTLQEMQAKIAALEASLTSAQSDAKAATEKLAGLSAERDTLKADCESLKLQLSKLESSNKEITEKLEAANKAIEAGKQKALEAANVAMEASASQCGVAVGADNKSGEVDHAAEYSRIHKNDHKKAAEYYAKHKKQIIG